MPDECPNLDGASSHPAFFFRHFRFAKMVGATAARWPPRGDRIKALLRRAFCGLVRSAHFLPSLARRGRRTPFSSCIFLPAFSLCENGRGDRIRTCGLVVPNDARYQAALHPDVLCRAVPFRRAGRNRSGDAPTASGGAPVGIRTPNLLIRSQVLYPVELRVLCQRRFRPDRFEAEGNVRGKGSLTREI